MNTSIQVGSQVIANVLGVEDLVGEVTMIYVDETDGLEMMEITYDVEVWDGDNVLDVPADSVRLAE